jgi:hypothetical protein
MEKDSSNFSTDHAEHSTVADSARRVSIVADNEEEHRLTFADIWKHHKAIIWWSFYFAMCAIGW